MCGGNDGDYEWTQLVWTRRKARKLHQCEACGRPIEKRETYRYSKGLQDGTFYIQKRCLRCDLIADAMWDRGCAPNFELVDNWEGPEAYIEDHSEDGLVADTEPVCALVFMTQAELEARA